MLLFEIIPNDKSLSIIIEPVKVLWRDKRITSLRVARSSHCAYCTFFVNRIDNCDRALVVALLPRLARPEQSAAGGREGKMRHTFYAEQSKRDYTEARLRRRRKVRTRAAADYM